MRGQESGFLNKTEAPIAILKHIKQLNKWYSVNYSKDVISQNDEWKRYQEMITSLFDKD